MKRNKDKRIISKKKVKGEEGEELGKIEREGNEDGE